VKKQLYIKIKNILKNFNKEGRHITIFYVVYSANFSLCFHHIRIDNVCEGDPVFQGM